MAATKINIAPVENKYIKLIMSVEDMDKEKLVDLGDSFLLKMNKKSKSGNELYFSVLFAKKMMNKPSRTSNPSIAITKNKNLITVTLTIMQELESIQESEGFYWIKTENAASPAFEFSYKMNESYYDKKVTQVLAETAQPENTD
ncbi:hypothetical protein [Niallia taxi]|uniref:hypothetical protein n=1 Tax=Niallia taxi TaxID=2499688 RepID=UPI003D288BE2